MAGYVSRRQFLIASALAASGLSSVATMASNRQLWVRRAPSFDSATTDTLSANSPLARPLWGLIGNDGLHLTQERAAGINTKLFRLSWREYYPFENQSSREYVARKSAELDALRSSGFSVILNLGYHDTPAWLHRNYPNSYYVNQYGRPYAPTGIDSGDANLVFNPDLRLLVDSYLATIFRDFGTQFSAVRLGGGRYGELTYPPASWDSKTNCYWAFDADARSVAPVKNWFPGQPSPAGQAQEFIEWYLDRLTDFQTWQVRSLRQHYDGDIMMLYPSWGIRPGQIESAVHADLDGSTPAERNGEIQRGYDFARQLRATEDPGVVVTTTWLDADASRLSPPGDASSDPLHWSPVKYLASLVERHPLVLRLYGENTGWGNRADMIRSVTQSSQFGLMGLMWFREDQLFSGHFATLADYHDAIATTAL